MTGEEGKKTRKMSERGRKKARAEEGTVMGGKNSNKDNTKVGGETCKTKKKKSGELSVLMSISRQSSTPESRLLEGEKENWARPGYSTRKTKNLSLDEVGLHFFPFHFLIIYGQT